MLEGDENATIENKGNRDNTCNTTCRVSALGFRPGQVYVNQGEEKEITIIDEDGNQDSWFLDDALDSIPWNEDSPKEVLPHTLANQDDVGEKVSTIMWFFCWLLDQDRDHGVKLKLQYALLLYR